MSNNHQPTDQRAKEIATLRALLDLAERIPSLYLPTLSLLSQALTGHTDEDANKRMDQIEADLAEAGVEFTTGGGGHNRSLQVPIGDERYELFHVWDRVMADVYARESYTRNVQVDEQPAGAVA